MGLADAPSLAPYAWLLVGCVDSEGIQLPLNNASASDRFYLQGCVKQEFRLRLTQTNVSFFNIRNLYIFCVCGQTSEEC